MPIYRLEPIDANHADWRGSRLPPTPIWVNAPTNGDARRMAQQVSVQFSRFTPKEKIIYNPWLSAGMVTCIEDASKEVPENTVLTGDGKLIPIKL